MSLATLTKKVGARAKRQPAASAPKSNDIEEKPEVLATAND